MVRLLSLLVIAACLASTAACCATFTLARDGKPAATIVIATEATRAAQFAAYELRWHLQQITGGEFPIVRDDEPVPGLAILVGDSKPVRALGLNPTSFKKQEYLIRLTSQALVLIGRDKDDKTVVQYNHTPSQAELDTWPGMWDEQGTMYAVYDFLERYCNVRWLNPTEFGTDIPRQPTLTVTGTEVRRTPFMKYRYAAYPGAESYDHYTGLWQWSSEGHKKWEAAAYPALHERFDAPGGYNLAKRGWNTLFKLRHREGGEICPGNHSLYGYYRRFWEPEKGQEQLFEGKHADWFAKRSAGDQEYAGQPLQMCYTSRGLVEQVAKDACEFFSTGKTYPGAQAGGDCFCVEPMDNAAFCKCDDCQKWLTGRDADSPFFTNGRHSDYFFQFVNEVARIVGNKYPDKKIVTLAYMTHGAPPDKFKLAPNVLVQYCFAGHRLYFDKATYEHEVNLLKQWRAQYPDRTLYLWLYYTFPVEIANNGKFHCFPGFFAHAIGEQFDLFRKYNYTGVFHCGYGQDVEAYVTYRLMDDPTLRVDDLLRDYFTRLYGPAAGPMRQLYETIEQTYCNPANYPEAIATKKIEGHHHQTEEVAWGYLGNEARMTTLGKLMEQAKAAAVTPEQKKRVELFELGTWDYMTQGRKLYLEHAKARYGAGGAPLRVPYASQGSLGRDPSKMDAGEALAISTWRSRIAEPTRRRLAARLLNDGECLYLRLEERCDPKTLKLTEDIQSGDYWQVLTAKESGGEIRELVVNAAGRQLLDAEPPNFPCAITKSSTGYSTTLALPLVALGKQGVQPGGHFLLNLVRRSPAGDEPMWSPSFGEFEDPAALRELVLDGPQTIPANVPSAAEIKRLETEGLVARWKLDEGRGEVVKSSGALTGKLVNKAGWVKDEGRSVVRLADSRGQHVDFGSDPSLNLTGPLTLMVWAKYEPTDTWYPGLLGKGYELTGTYGMHLRPGGTVWFEIDAPDGTRYSYNPTDLCLPPGQWCHVAATYDGAVMRVFVNGREAGPGRQIATAIRTNNEPLRFGWLGSYGHFNGCVRDASVHGRALTPAEVFGQYLSGR